MENRVLNEAEMAAAVWRGDMGYLQLFALTALLLAALWYAARWRWPGAGLQRLAAWGARPHPLLWIVAAGAVLRVPRLFESLWYDEAFTARIAALPAAHFLPAVQGDVHPPLFYAIDWLTAHTLGASEPLLRLPALIFGLLLIVYGQRLALALGLSGRVALIYAALLAVLPAALYYSNEARGYTLLALLAFGALRGLAERRPWFYLAHAALLPLTHNIGFVYLGVFTLAGMWHWRREAQSYLPLGLALLPALLWLPAMLAQTADISDGFWLQPVNGGLAVSIVTEMTVSHTLHHALALPVLMGAIGATLAGLIVYRRWLLTDERGQLLALLVLGVPLVLALAAWLWLPVYLTRALLPVGLGLALLWARLLAEWPLSRVVIPATLALALTQFFSPSLSRFDMRAALRDCAGAASIYATSIPAALFASYYLPGAQLAVWPEAGDINQTLSDEAMAAMGLLPGEFASLPRPLCLLALTTSSTRDVERAYVAQLAAGAPHSRADYPINIFYSVEVLRFDQRTAMAVERLDSGRAGRNGLVGQARVEEDEARGQTR